MIQKLITDIEIENQELNPHKMQKLIKYEIRENTLIFQKQNQIEALKQHREQLNKAILDINLRIATKTEINCINAINYEIKSASLDLKLIEQKKVYRDFIQSRANHIEYDQLNY